MASQNPEFEVLSQPLDSCAWALVYIAGSVTLLCIVAFIGLKYYEVLSTNRRISDTTVFNPTYRRRFVPRTPFLSRPSLRSPTRRTPLSQVSNASSIYSGYQSSSSDSHAVTHTQPTLRFTMARWRLAPGWVNIGAVEEGRIAKRRRALSGN